jgi:hypothetical protein
MFANAREAKEFLVTRIVAEAQRESVSLSEVERKMLYFSETGWTLPDIMVVSDAFDRDYDQAKYEEKITTLIRNFCAKARKENRNDFDSWKEAARVIRQEDHYLLMMIDAANNAPNSSSGRVLKLVAVGFGLAILALVLVYVAR